MDTTGPYTVELLSQEKFDLYWPRISKELDTIPHIWSTWWTKDYIREVGMTGQWQVWGIGTEQTITGVIFTQVLTYPARKLFQVVLAFGTGFDEILETIDQVFSNYAKRMDCDLIEIVGRSGWERKLQRLGFKKVTTVVAKRLYPERVN